MSNLAEGSSGAGTGRGLATRFLLRIVLALGLVSTGLLVVEATLRFTESGTRRAQRDGARRAALGLPEPPGFYAQENDLGWTCTPGATIFHERNGFSAAFTIGPDGMRRNVAVESRPQPREVQHRVLILGGTEAFGLGARDEETLDRFLLDAAPQISLSNLSSPGWSPDQAFMAYKKYRDRIQPTEVVLVISHLVDLHGLRHCRVNHRLKPTIRLGGASAPEIVSVARLAGRRPTPGSLAWDSHLAFALASFQEDRFLRSACSLEQPELLDGQGEVDRLGIYSAASDREGKNDPLWRRLEYLLANLSEDVRGSGGRLMLVLLPLGNLSDIVERLRKQGKLHGADGAPPDGTVEVVEGRFRGLAEQLHAAYLPLREEWAQLGPAVFSPEGHYGAEGNRAVAAAIAAELAR